MARRKRNSIAEIELLVAQLRRQLERLAFPIELLTEKVVIAEITAAFESLVQAQAERYGQSQIDAAHEDLVQVARVGLIEACYTFDRTKGAFPTHATWSIRRALAIYVGSIANPVRLPTRWSYRLPKLRRAIDQLAQTLQREPTVAELSDAVGLSEAMIATMLAYNAGAMSLDVPRLDYTDGELRITESPWVESYAAATPSPEDMLIAKEEWEMRERENEEELG